MSRTSTALCLAVGICLSAALIASCSKKTTSPGYGNTGGGGGTAALELNGNLASGGGSYSHMFGTAGTFNYHCTIHPGCTGLAGKVVVVAPGTGILNRVLAISQSGGSGGTYPACSALSVSNDTVHVGDTVTWTNNSPVQHTVVSQ